MLKFTLKDKSPFEYLQTSRVYINGKDKSWHVFIISKCLNLNNRGIPIGANWKYILRDWRHVIHVACLVYVTLNLYFGLFSVVLYTLREIMKQCCNNDTDQLSFCIFPTKHGPQMEQKQTRVINNRVLWTYRIMQIWEETVANFCILPVWTSSIAQKCFSILL